MNWCGATVVVFFLVLKLIFCLLTGENKLTIRDAGIAEIVANLEKEWLGSKDFEKHQAGFCSQWILDNICEPVIYYYHEFPMCFGEYWSAPKQNPHHAFLCMIIMSSFPSEAKGM